MKCFVAAAALLGMGSAEPFLHGAALTTSYASAIAPSIHAAPAFHTGPAVYSHAAPAVHTGPAVYSHAAPAVRALPAITPAVTYSSNLVSPVAPISTYAAQPVLRTAPVTTIKAVPTGVTASQYHSQDEFGNYAYGYENQNSEKHEEGNAHTGVRGHYSYVDGHGLNRRVDYVADGLGFRASGNAPSLLRHKRDADAFYGTFASPSLVSYPAVPYAHAPAVAAYTAAPQPIVHAQEVAAYTAAPQPIAHPVQVAQLKAVPSAPISQQYHSQDEFGNYAYGYANQNSEKHEEGNAYNAVRGHYSYVDSYGLNRRVDYVADGFGFRASGDGVNGAGMLLRHKRDADADADAFGYGYGLTSHAFPAVSPYPYTSAAYASPAVAHVARPIVNAPISSYASQPVLRTAPVTTIKAVPTGVTASQYHSQDEFGNYAYGYQNQNSEKEEAGNVHTGVRGHYSYVDGYGLNRRVDYVADDLGFRHV